MNLSIATRIFIGYAVVLTTFAAVSIFSVAELHQTQQEIRLVSQGYLHLSQDASSIETFHANQERDTARLIEEKSVETRRDLIRLARLYFWSQMAERVSTGRERAREVKALAPSSEKAFIVEIEQRFDELGARYREYEQAADRVFSALERTSPDRQTVNARMAELKQLEASIGRDIRVLRHSLDSRIRERVQNAETRERRTGIAIIGLSVLAIAVGLLVTGLSARALKPVRTLIDAVSRIGRGDYSATLGVQGQDEIAVLAREFDAMSRSLRAREAQLREKQEALVRAEKLAAVGRVSAQVAHEIRNPLSSIGLNVEMLQDAFAGAQFEDPAEAKEAEDLLRSITVQVDRLTEITEDYLRMARLPEPSLQPGNVNEVLGSVLDFTQFEIAQAKVEIVRTLADDLPRVSMDDGQIRQVFLNLLRNSRQAMAGGGTLRVESRMNGEWVEVHFQDSGHGMTPEVHARIFEPFFTTKKDGTGLGLAVSRQIVQTHGGDLLCDSAPGQGTSFTVRLPAVRAAALSA